MTSSLRTTALISLALVVSACASRTPKFAELGENSYMFTLRAEKTQDGKKIARREVASAAEQYCVDKGQHARPTHLSSGVSDFMLGDDVELNFRCQQEPFNGP